jgi:hypothetical protein
MVPDRKLPYYRGLQTLSSLEGLQKQGGLLEMRSRLEFVFTGGFQTGSCLHWRVPDRKLFF